MNIAALDRAIRTVCPIDGVNSDGVIFFKGEATAGQKAAAQAVLDGWVDVPEVPQSVPSRKAKELLLSKEINGQIAFDIINNHFAGLTGIAGRKARNLWVESQVFERYRSEVIGMFQLLGIDTEAERDQWFIEANALP